MTSLPKKGLIPFSFPSLTAQPGVFSPCRAVSHRGRIRARRVRCDGKVKPVRARPGTASAVLFFPAFLGLSVFARGVSAGTAAAGDVEGRIADLVRRLGESDYAGKSAYDRLVRIGPAAVPALLKAAEDRVPRRRWWAVSALCTIGDTRAVEVVLRRVKDPHPIVRYTAIYHGRVFVRRDRRVARMLTGMLDSPDTGAVGWAAEGLGRVRYRPAFDAIVRAVKHRDPKVRWRCLDALGRIDAPAAVGVFVDRLGKDGEPALRRLAAGWLGRARVRDRRTIGSLVGALRDRSPEVRLAAWRALRSLTGETFGLAESARDVPRAVAVRAVRWWLDHREEYPRVGVPGPGVTTRAGPESATSAPPNPGPSPDGGGAAR